MICTNEIIAIDGLRIVLNLSVVTGNGTDTLHFDLSQGVAFCSKALWTFYILEKTTLRHVSISSATLLTSCVSTYLGDLKSEILLYNLWQALKLKVLLSVPLPNIFASLLVL